VHYRIYQEDMVQVYNKMSDNDKELWSINRLSWDTVYQTPKEKYISMFITEEAALGTQGRLGENGWASAQSPFKKGSSCVGLSCVHATMH
jgi:hypothetical protein